MNLLQLFFIFLRLGLTSFGGPVAHLGFFREEFVSRRKWFTDEVYADLVSLCQFLPGPASSQVGMAIGYSRGGVAGSILAWLGFTLPSAILLTLFGLGVAKVRVSDYTLIIHSLKVFAVAIVAQAVLGMGKKLCPDKERVLIALGTALLLIFISSPFAPVFILAATGIMGAYYFKTVDSPRIFPFAKRSPSLGRLCLVLFFVILFVLPFFRELDSGVRLFDSFYRAGALVFGGGHVVLPLLQSEVVSSGLVSNEIFMAGYGVANIVPGPLFTFSAYLGAVSVVPPNGWAGALLSLVAVFLPSFLLVIGVLPFWEKVRQYPWASRAVMGINAGVVGLLLAALYHPVWTSAIFSFRDLVVAILGFIMLEVLKAPPWLVALGTVVVMSVFSFLMTR